MRQRVRRTAAATGILALMITLGTTGEANAGHPPERDAVRVTSPDGRLALAVGTGTAASRTPSSATAGPSSCPRRSACDSPTARPSAPASA